MNYGERPDGSGADVMSDAVPAYDASVDASYTGEKQDDLIRRVKELVLAVETAITYMERVSSDPDLHHADMMRALRSAVGYETLPAKRRRKSVKVHDDFQWEKLQAFVNDHEDRIRISFAGDLVENAAGIVEHYHQVATNSLVAVQRFQTELLVQFRALALVADSVGSGETHNEKNARLRGLINLLEGAYEKVACWEFNLQRSYWSYESVFRSDYPARRHLSRIRDLEAEVGALKTQLGQQAAGRVADGDDDSDPFARK